MRSFEELTGARGAAAPEKAGGKRPRRQVAAALPKKCGELRQKPRESQVVARSETGRAAGVAGRPRGMDLHEERVAIAVEPEVDQGQHVPARPPLLPKTTARAARGNDLPG